jgi:hypothetical protein
MRDRRDVCWDLIYKLLDTFPDLDDYDGGESIPDECTPDYWVYHADYIDKHQAVRSLRVELDFIKEVIHYGPIGLPIISTVNFDEFDVDIK